jgi:hypothetical protein
MMMRNDIPAAALEPITSLVYESLDAHHDTARLADV